MRLYGGHTVYGLVDCFGLGRREKGRVAKQYASRQKLVAMDGVVVAGGVIDIVSGALPLT